MGDTFVGSHGLAAGGPQHGEHPYTVVGVLEPTASVLDRVVLTPVESVWLAHGIEPHEHHDEAGEAASANGDHDAHGDEHAVEHEETHADEPTAAPGGERAPEITSLLIRYNSPIGAVELPLQVNRQSALQAASPAMESARLLSLVGIGVDTLRGLGLLLIATAGLSVFIALSNAMQERRYDLAVMRTLGASRGQLFTQPLLEGLLLAGAGALLGIALGPCRRRGGGTFPAGGAQHGPERPDLLAPGALRLDPRLAGRCRCRPAAGDPGVSHGHRRRAGIARVNA